MIKVLSEESFCRVTITGCRPISVAKQSPDGLEVVPGSSTYVIRGNWKMQLENAVDGHHVSTVHRVFAATVGNREQRDGSTGLAQTEGGRITGKVPAVR